jgi:two-component system, NtrC family, sensor kinase
VLEALIESAARLCGAPHGLIFRFDGTSARAVAAFNNVPGFKELWAENPILPDRKTATGRALVERRAIHIPDVLADSEYSPPEGMLKQAQSLGQYRTTLVVPMMRQGLPLGTITLWKTKVEPFTDRQIAVVTTFADQAAIAIENVRLFNEVQARTAEAQVSLEYQTAISNVLNVLSRSPSELQPALDAIVQTAARLCEADFAVFFRLQEGKCYIGASNAADDYIRFARENPFVPTPSSCSGRALLERRTVHVLDASSDPEYAMPGYQHVANNRTMLGVPLLREGIALGAIVLWKTRVEPFTEKQIELITTFADQAVIAIENVRLFEAEQHRTRELTESLEQQTATSEVLRVISSTQSELEPVFRAMLENAVRICQAEFGNVYRWDGRELEIVAAHNVPAAFAEHRKRVPYRPRPTNAIGRMVVTKALVQAIDASAEPAYTEHREPGVVAAVELGGVRTYLAVPLLKDGELVGALTIYRHEVRPFTDKQIELVKTFADQAVIAIENARLLNELRQRTADLSESLEQQTATAKVLEVISRAAFDLQAVFDTVVESSVRLCGADRAFLMRYDGELFRVTATFNATAEFKAWVAQHPVRPGRHSATGRVALERRTIHIPDVLADPEYSYAVGEKGVEEFRTLLGVPILKGDDLLGVMIIYHLEVRPFTDKQIALVETFADQAAIAIENARLLDQLRLRTDEPGRSVEELRALGEVSQAVNSTLDLKTVLSTIVAKAVQLSGTEAGAIYVFDDAQREFGLRATYGMNQELIDALAHAYKGIDESTIALILTQREPVQAADLRDETATELNQIAVRAGFRARLVAPLVRGEDVLGLLVVRRRTPGAFPQNIVDLIKTFAAQSAVAIENARLFENVEASLEELRAAQDRLVQTQKLASLGQLTAGIAHEIKNPLNFVNNFSAVSTELIDELQETLGRVSVEDPTRAEIKELAETLRDNLGKIVQHGKRADSIVKNMLLHSREGSGEHRPVDVNAIVEEAVNLAYHGARAEKRNFNITLERSLDPAAGQVDCFPQEITRVLLNLISNGFYAATKRKGLAANNDFEPKLMAATKGLGDRVEIRIRDNGVGISPEVKERMFNPFFTTKPAGEGTGLGLSISHDIIVKQHAGSIEVDSEPGAFTEFRVILRRAAVFPGR